VSQQQSVERAETALREAIRKCADVFENPKERRKLRDLSPRFWVALLDLRAAAGDPGRKLHEELGNLLTAYKHLGAPGDFGYGHPTGDALQRLYAAHNALCAANRAARETTEATDKGGAA
jgi:hypothetical protein